MTTQLSPLGTATPGGYVPVSKPPTGGSLSNGNESTNTGAAGTSAPGLAPRPAPTLATSTPGATASVAAPDTSALGQDPAYLAYLRAIGVQDTTQSANVQSQIDAINRNVALRLPQMQQDAGRQNQLLQGRMEARGILNSGETENNLSNQEMLQQRQQAALQDQAAQRAAGLINTLAEARANRGVGTAEHGLTAGQAVANANGTNQINTDVANAQTALGTP